MKQIAKSVGAGCLVVVTALALVGCGSPRVNRVSSNYYDRNYTTSVSNGQTNYVENVREGNASGPAALGYQSPAAPNAHPQVAAPLPQAPDTYMCDGCRVYHPTHLGRCDHYRGAWPLVGFRVNIGIGSGHSHGHYHRPRYYRRW